jgi:predicted RNase H-like nuclease (RuvC/YqgF family)
MSETTKSNEQLVQELDELKAIVANLESQLAAFYNEIDVNKDSSLITEYQQELSKNITE